MCDFKVGDEVVCLNGAGWLSDKDFSEIPGPGEGDVCTVIGFDNNRIMGDLLAVLEGWGDEGFLASCFRKVERKNDNLSIEAFLTIKDGFEEPKRAPAKKVPA